MKKLVLSIVFIASLAIWGTMNAQAQEVQKKASTEQVQNQTPRTGYVDANSDGVCDNYDGKRAGKGLGPGNGQGQGRANGKGLGKGNGNRNGKGLGQRLRDGSGPRCQKAKTE